MRKVLVVVLCGILLGVAAPAMAQGPTQGAYSGSASNQLSQVQGVQSTGATNGSPTAATSSTLPFTGLDVGLVVVAAIALAGTGLVLRRQSSSGS